MTKRPFFTLSLYYKNDISFSACMTSISNPGKSLWHCGLETFCYAVATTSLYYLYHNVNVLLILQQTEIWIKVKLVVPGVGFGQDHLVLPQCLEENLLPLYPLFCQQLPLKDDTTGSHPLQRAKNKMNLTQETKTHTRYSLPESLWRWDFFGGGLA